MRLVSVVAAALLAAAPVFAQTPSANPHAGHAMEMPQAPQGSGAQGGTPADALTPDTSVSEAVFVG